MRISDWSSDVCSSDLARDVDQVADLQSGCRLHALVAAVAGVEGEAVQRRADALRTGVARQLHAEAAVDLGYEAAAVAGAVGVPPAIALAEELEGLADRVGQGQRSEERRGGKECVSPCISRGSPDH